MLKEFRAFLLRGNVVDLAVAVVIGAAFGTVVSALVSELLTPLIAIPGSTDFSDIEFTVNDSTFGVGRFLNALIAFLGIAGAVFFLVVRPANALMARRKTEPAVEATTRPCPYCLSNIPVKARKCAFCASTVGPAATGPTVEV